MRPWRARAALLALVWTASAVCGAARAEVAFHAGGGTAVGTFNASKPARVRATPLAVHLNYEARPFGVGPVLVGGAFKSFAVSYEMEGTSFNGSGVMAGATLGLDVMRFSSSFVRAEAAYHAYNVLTVTSETEASINGLGYKHSALTTYTGPGATELLVSWIAEIKEGQFTKHERLRYGITLGMLTQTITKADTQIAVSRTALAPRETVAETVSYSLTLMSASVLVGFVF